MDTPKYDSRQVKDLTHEQLQMYLADIIPFCYKACGESQVDLDLAMITGVVADELLDPVNEHGNMYLEEVKRALWDGAKGKICDYFRMNIKSMICFLNKYTGSELQRSLRKAINDEIRAFGPKQIEAHRRSQNEIDKQTREYIITMAERCRKGDPLGYMLNCYTKRLKDGCFKECKKDILHGVVELDRYDIAEAYVKEAIRLQMEEEAELICRYFHERGLFADR